MAISAGLDHTCAVTAGGAAKCWGRNFNGMLGDGTTTDRPTPVAVSGLASGVTAISAGSAHTCALTNAGAVTCWGGNTSGQLGDGTTTPNSPTPVAVTGLGGGVTAISAGHVHTCALTSAGADRCWGDGGAGQLGDGGRDSRSTPVGVSGLGSGVTAIAAAGGNLAAHSCAVTGGGAVMCWGYNADGELGDGTRDLRVVPVGVSGLGSSAIAVTAGTGHSCALLRDGSVSCWGGNRVGQGGDLNTPAERVTAVPVIFRPPPATDQYGDRLFFTTPCNPSGVRVDVPQYFPPTPIGPRPPSPLPPLFVNGVAWVDYEGIPVAVSPPFRLTSQRALGFSGYGALWPVPSARAAPAGRYTVHVLLQGNGADWSLPQLDLVLTTLAETTTIDARLGPDCSPIATSAVAATGRVSARRVATARRASRASLGRGVLPRSRFPKARLCGAAVCVQARPGGRWKTVAG